MARRLLMILGFALLAALPAQALAAGGGAACSGPQTASAVSQYCEDIPSATGGHAAGPGTPAVAASLPRRISRALSHAPTGSSRHALLSLPAGLRRTSVILRPAATGTSLLWLWLVLAAVTVALAAAVGERRRRRHRPA